jgi:hypothetical protein
VQSPDPDGQVSPGCPSGQHPARPADPVMRGRKVA